VGSSELPLGGPLLSSDDRYPMPYSEDYDQARIVDKRVGERVERWFVESPSMGRVIGVQIKRSATGAAAPFIYMLDGIGGPTPNSGWINHGAAKRVFGNEEATLIMPTHAAASLYSDGSRTTRLWAATSGRPSSRRSCTRFSTSPPSSTSTVTAPSAACS
jgi:S-formylglutathione hydrolase FrmB